MSDSTKYKPYTVKDYKQLQSTVQSLKLGGLGANIGTEEWEKAKRKAAAAQEYAKSLRQGQVLYGAGTSGNSQQFKRNLHQKEKTARDRAIEFAKSIPKPKVKVGSSEYGRQSETNDSIY